MSLDIDVTNPRTGESRQMNWLRSPYGLERWASANYTYFAEREPAEERSLWHVLNHWNYDKAPQVDKPLFLEVVKKYGKVIMQLSRAYFWFDESGFRQYIQPHLDVLPRSNMQTFAQYAFDGCVRYHFHQKEHIGIPMQYFGHPCFELSDRYRPNTHTLQNYQAWYAELIEFAEILQYPDAVFYCSN